MMNIMYGLAGGSMVYISMRCGLLAPLDPLVDNVLMRQNFATFLAHDSLYS